jgi:hypothetical protein
VWLQLVEHLADTAGFRGDSTSGSGVPRVYVRGDIVQGRLMEHVAPIILAIVALLGAVGAAGKFVWDKVERRFENIENDLKLCYAREVTTKERRGILVTVIDLLITELKTVAPLSETITHSERLMERVKRIDDAEDAIWEGRN